MDGQYCHYMNGGSRAAGGERWVGSTESIQGQGKRLEQGSGAVKFLQDLPPRDEDGNCFR